jgi:hypothetical protein
MSKIKNKKDKYGVTPAGTYDVTAVGVPGSLLEQMEAQQSDFIYTPEEVLEMLVQQSLPPDFTKWQLAERVNVTPQHSAVGVVTAFVDEENVDERFRYTALDANVLDKTNGTFVYKLPNVKDKLRACLGAYWSDQNPFTETYSPDTNNLIYVRNKHPNIGSLDINIGSGDQSVFTDPLDATQYALALIPKQGRFSKFGNKFVVQKFEKYIEDMIEKDEWFYDHTMSVVSPYDRYEVERLNSKLRIMYANVKSQYNYYIEDYETIMSSSATKEVSFPNMYVFFAYRAAMEKYEEDKAKNSQSVTLPNPAFKDHITLGGKIEEEVFDSMSLPYDDRKEFRVGDPAGQYFNNWSRQYSKAEDLYKTGNKFKNIFFPQGDMDLLAKANSQQRLFPMWANIEFSTDVETEFAEILKQSQLSSVLLSDIYKSVGSNNFITMFQAVRSSVLTKFDIDNSSGESLNITKTHYDIDRRRVFDITEWLESDYSTNDGLLDGYDTDNNIFIGAYASERKVSEGPQYTFWKNLMSVVFSGKLRRLVEKHQRNFKEVFLGKPAYHETVCYRVAKFKGDVSEDTGEPIQNFYFPNSNEIDVLNFVDTQVKYGEKYTYVVYAYELVVGSKYQYKHVQIDSSTESHKVALVQVSLEPSLKIIEVPYYKKAIHLLDSPPVYPEVEFIPYRGVNNRVRLQLNGNVGKYEMLPVVINDEDEIQINRFNVTQGKLPGEKIKYESDDYPAKFQIWRTDKKPARWTDFAGHLRKTVSTGSRDFLATSATFIDKIRPNKKYYYAFRSIDVHGNISYPTVVYEYEMVDDTGSIYPLIHVISLESVEPSTPAKSAKRYIRIYPSLDNTLIDPEIADGVESGNELTTVPLGIRPEGERAWGKKFKIRITSKNTGKKFDLNVEFKHEHIKNIKVVKPGR